MRLSPFAKRFPPGYRKERLMMQPMAVVKGQRPKPFAQVTGDNSHQLLFCYYTKSKKCVKSQDQTDYTSTGMKLSLKPATIEKTLKHAPTSSTESQGKENLAGLS